MKIFNVRLGLATNSSSSHSLIFIPGQAYGDDADGEFGWDDFTIGHREGKLRYTAVILRDALKRAGLPDSYVNFTIKGLIGSDVEIRTDDYIDHQSTYFLPCEFNSKMPDVDFIDEFRHFMLRDDLVILGGNDNSDGHPLAAGGFNLPIQREAAPSMVCRKDPNYGFWTLFAPDTGAKIRFSFDDLDGAPEKATTPELVDLKVTDYCPYDCPFCYQDSTEKGRHADRSDLLYSIIPALGKLKVFEVAIGGGEPTLSPDFLDILQSCRDEGMVPNFTTKSLAWLRDQKQRPKIIELAGAFAFSVIKPEEIDELGELLIANSIPQAKASIQVVMGVHDRDTFKTILRKARAARVRVTLLGYKTNGRGASCVPIPYGWWLDVVKELSDNHELTTICIDTALAAEYEDMLETAGIPRWSYHIKEGKFSMYIDAVEGRIAPSSYCEENEIWELIKDTVDRNIDNPDWESRIRETFARF